MEYLNGLMGEGGVKSINSGRGGGYSYLITGREIRVQEEKLKNKGLGREIIVQKCWIPEGKNFLQVWFYL